MEHVIRSGYRGDTRAPELLEEHGGFVPQYLLRPHQGGFEGFLACKNKVPKKIGCNCPGFGEQDLFNKARKRFLELMGKPINLQAHVIFNNDGFISTAIAPDDAYYGHNYKVQAAFYEFSIADAFARFRINARIVPLIKNWKVEVSHVNIGQSDLLAVTPHGGVELTFITPILYRHLTYVGEKK